MDSKQPLTWPLNCLLHSPSPPPTRHIQQIRSYASGYYFMDYESLLAPHRNHTRFSHFSLLVLHFVEHFFKVLFHWAHTKFSCRHCRINVCKLQRNYLEQNQEQKRNNLQNENKSDREKCTFVWLSLRMNFDSKNNG